MLSKKLRSISHSTTQTSHYIHRKKGNRTQSINSQENA